MEGLEDMGGDKRNHQGSRNRDGMEGNRGDSEGTEEVTTAPSRSHCGILETASTAESRPQPRNYNRCKFPSPSFRIKM